MTIRHTSFLIVVILLSVAVLHGAENPLVTEKTSQPEEAIKKAGEAGRFSLLIVTDSSRKELDAPGTEMRKAVTNFAGIKSKQTATIDLDISTKDAAALVSRYGLGRAPLPLLLVIAPNGAVTGGYPQRVSTEQLEASLVSRVAMEMMKPLQDGKLVLLSVRGKNTTNNAEADAGIKDFSATSGLQPVLITIDPADATESKLLAQLQVEPTIKQALTFMLVPPGRMAGRFEGVVSAQQISAALKNAMRSSCSAPGCADPSCPPPSQSGTAATSPTPTSTAK